MRVVVDFDRCQSNAVCMQHAPEVFEVRDDGYLYVLDENPDEALRVKVEQAARYCPTMAISVVDEESDGREGSGSSSGTGEVAAAAEGSVAAARSAEPDAPAAG